MKNIAHLLFALQAAEKSVLDELKNQYPVGSTVKVLYRPEVKINEYTVIGHRGGMEGRLVVRLGKDGHQTSIPFVKIVND